jgi:hypothetical protein
MKPLIIIALSLLSTNVFAQENPVQYKVVTIVESIIPGGMGRSRIIENQSESDASEKTEGTDSKQGKVKRGDIKIDNFSETKLLNFYSLTGINFQNIASNDALITSKMNELSKAGWKLAYVTSGVESNAGSQDGEGIFITRLVFSK